MLGHQKVLYHNNQKFEGNCLSIKYKFKQKGEQLTCINLIEVINEDKSEYTDKEEHSHPSVRSFRRRYFPPGKKHDEQESESEIESDK